MLVRRAIVFLLLALGSVTPVLAQGLAGDWIGLMSGGFKVRLHFEKSGSSFHGKLINPSGNETGLDVVTSDGTRLHFAVNKLGLSYDGVWSDAERAWKGHLLYQGVYPLILKRATAEEMGSTAHKRPQEDAIKAEPAPYVQKEVLFGNPAANNKLAGTLSLPHGEGPYPAVVLVSGTGFNTRDEDVSGHKVFLVLADALNRKGFAVLRYDKRGVGGSSGDFGAATTADFASDAEAAVAWLKSQPEIDATRIGVLGHSEGGTIAPMVAAADRSVAFVVMIAGPAVRGDRLFTLQSAMTSKVYGAPQAYISKREVFDQELFSAIISAPSDAAALVRARAIVAQGVADKLVDADEAQTLATDTARRWERYFLAYDPAPTLARLTVPVLALYGSLDVQVPAKQNSEAAREALRNNPNGTVMELPGMNHLLQDARTGAPSEYNDIEETMSPTALKVISDWLGAKVLMRRDSEGR